jgi:hypothetical protein
MAKKGRAQAGIIIGGGSKVEVGGDMVGGNKTTTTNTFTIHASTSTNLFGQVDQKIATHRWKDPKQRKAVETAVSEIKTKLENSTGQPVKVSWLEKRLSIIARMAPDIYDVVVATLASPVLGIKEVIDKIRKKAEENLVTDS